MPGTDERDPTPIAVVLAAGKGTRMESELPKVLVQARGRPLVEYVLDALAAAGVSRQIVVVGYRADLVRQALAGRAGVEFAEQYKPPVRGTVDRYCVVPRQKHLCLARAIRCLAVDLPVTRAVHDRVAAVAPCCPTEETGIECEPRFGPAIYLTHPDIASS